VLRTLALQNLVEALSPEEKMFLIPTDYHNASRDKQSPHDFFKGKAHQHKFNHSLYFYSF